MQPSPELGPERSCLQFEPGSLGKPLDKAARESYMQSIYGERPASRVLLPESALLLEHGEPANGNAAAAQTAAAGPAVPHPPVPDSQLRGPRPTAGTGPGRPPPAAPPAGVARLQAPPYSNGKPHPPCCHNLVCRLHSRAHC